ncbi:MAG: dUTP diphosphatase [Bacillota bacterium]|uniref:dUTP diphosphatase n=1 Tax=Virgibacillus salarius TaxID=447199 RepID=A0A941E1A1_9BACI|nr:MULTISPECIES: dUTP diphosphatase [Virgibacillus]NAZ10618.1 dUTPase [Agaribacter marinus]MBR7797908.1 dUTP diphosphatase [Virgibacillus salarius]MCC2251862.1 dUTP diphosphatase [Virgibacillus sp. AGTR]MDY7046157.1 dUTP diphosphatase [Virgibacillus sp. M23]QRZ17654.1 dUTP diphosphatase [Virgibacillus sp. AGTR]
MNWKELYNMQTELDSYIEKNNNIKKEEVFKDKVLALLVELGELANETRCFKFWSNKPRSEKSVILEEYVDGIHFILSLGITKGYYYQGEALPSVDETETELFLRMFTVCDAFYRDQNEYTYDQLWRTYLQLGSALGFSEKDVKYAYLEKNKVNYTRQHEGY